MDNNFLRSASQLTSNDNQRDSKQYTTTSRVLTTAMQRAKQLLHMNIDHLGNLGIKTQKGCKWIRDGSNIINFCT